jgi:hypothetical protein
MTKDKASPKDRATLEAKITELERVNLQLRIENLNLKQALLNRDKAELQAELSAFTPAPPVAPGPRPVQPTPQEGQDGSEQ